jgi:hypothetical protein
MMVWRIVAIVLLVVIILALWFGQADDVGW